LFNRLASDGDIRRNFGDVADCFVHQRASLVPDLTDGGRQGVADSHGEHPGRDNVEGGTTLLGLSDGPIKRSCAFRRAIDPNDDPM
jgi:hypothetical protein